MAIEWFISAVLIAVATPVFGHFETVRPVWVRVARWLVYLAVTGLLGATAGRPWTLLWILGLPLIGATFHIVWCVRHGINPWTAQPRDRYEQLRGRGARSRSVRPAGLADASAGGGRA